MTPLSRMVGRRHQTQEERSSSPIYDLSEEIRKAELQADSAAYESDSESHSTSSMSPTSRGKQEEEDSLFDSSLPDLELKTTTAGKTKISRSVLPTSAVDEEIEVLYASHQNVSPTASDSADNDFTSSRRHSAPSVRRGISWGVARTEATITGDTD